jgi:rhamnogalacturonyl hydrolase YesR
MKNLESSFLKLKTYCEAENFKGWDPYDGLNSKLFNATPLKHWDLARLVWIQGFKRSPINFRKLLLVPKQHNAKGIGLFLNGYCELHSLATNGNHTFGSAADIENKITLLADLVLQLQRRGYSGACWGYNFDWQARRLFLFPAHTPTVVATSFCVQALLKAFKITKNQEYLKTAISAANFIIKDLNRTDFNSGFLFSYSPLKGNDTVINASLLGAKTLSLIYQYSKDPEHLELARTTIKACCEAQQENGSWVYGMLPVQNWIDSFHTGYNLDAIQVYQNVSGNKEFNINLEKGFQFYIQNFFLEDGTPKYYHDQTYPIDIHCPGQLFVNLSVHDKFVENKELAHKVMQWTLQNMQDKKGYFYYQLKKGISSKISYMRWSNAFMFNAMSYYLTESIKADEL